MNEFIRSMVILLPVSSLLLIALIKLFWVIRSRFPVTVNCWFCNKNDRVPYEFQNNFVCSGCEQYNGFDKDGGYNREIPEMHYTKLNQIKNCVFSEENIYALKKSNGLCEACNRDQELKILQLAAFVPEDEDNFDEEIEKYNKSLETAYRLCGRCERVVRRSLNQVKSRIVGSNMKKVIGKLNEMSKLTKRSKTVKLLAYLLFMASLCSAGVALTEFQELRQYLTSVVGAKIVEMDWLLRPISYILAVKSLMKAYIHQILDNPILQGAFMHLTMTAEAATAWISSNIEFNSETQHDLKEVLNVIAMFANVILIVLFEDRKQPLTLWALLLIWISKTLLHNHQYITETDHTHNLQVFDVTISTIALFLSYKCLYHTRRTFRRLGNLNQSFHKISPEIEEDSEDETNQFETSSSFQKSYETTTGNGSLLNSTFKSYTGTHYGSVVNTNRPPSVFSSSFKSPSEFNYSNATVKDKEGPVAQLEMTKLNLSTVSALNRSFLTATDNPFYNHLNLDRQTPLSCFSFRSNAVVSPPKLNCSTVTDPSWVAGGFWTTSPKKSVPPSTDFMPIMSRTSSQSSGFESQGGNGGSRENSLPKDSDRSVLAEAMVRPIKPHPIYPDRQSNVHASTTFLKPSIIRNMQYSVTSPSRTSLYSRQSDRSIFGEPGFNDTNSLYSYRSNRMPTNNQVNSINTTTYTATQSLANKSIFNFKKFSNDLPNF